MRRRAYLLAGLGGSLLLVSAWAIRKTELPSKDFTIRAGQCLVPVTAVEPVRSDTQRQARRAAIVLHGLAGNRRVMRILGENLAADDLCVYLIDLPGHGDNTETFSFLRAEECAATVVEKLVRDGTISPRQTAIIGHSLGGAIAIRLADYVPVTATVALSPAPMILPRRIPANLLVFSAQYDFPALKRQAEVLLQAAGGSRTASDDFAQLRAFHLERLAGRNHHSVLDDPKVAAQTALWIAAALDPDTLRSAGLTAWTGRVEWGSSGGARPPRRAFGIALTAAVAPLAGLGGLLLLFPLALTVVLSPSAAGEGKAKDIAGGHPRKAVALLEGALFASLTVLILRFAVPTRFLHIYSGDYLASLLVIFGALLIAFNFRAAKLGWASASRAVLGGAILGFGTMLAMGAWLDWRLADLWLNGARWWRFGALLPFCFVFGFAEEVVLGPVEKGQRRVWRFLVSLLLRFEVWFAAVFAFYALGSGQVLIGVLAPALAGFSILQRFGADEVRLCTGSAKATALFGAILAAWFIAGVFPLT